MKAYDYPSCQRTSCMLDRLMKLQKQRLLNGQRFHGNLSSANASMRAHALLVNFCDYCPPTIKKYKGVRCPFEKLNGYRYRHNWLENLLVAASMNGYRNYNQLIIRTKQN